MKFQKFYPMLYGIISWCIFFSMAQAQVVDRILAVVDNEIITQVQLEKAIISYKQQIQSANMSHAARQQALEKLKNSMLDQMIDRSLARQEAQKYHIEVSDEEVDAAVESMRIQNNLSLDQFTLALEAQGMQMKEYREQIRQEILQSRLINHLVRSKVIVTESETRQYYDAHIQEYQNPRTYHLRNILVETRDLAYKIKARLDQGEDFAELARQHSVYANAVSGGELGSFTIDSFSPEVRACVEKLKKSEYSRVLETENGYQLFWVEDIVPAGGKPFDQVKESIHKKLYHQASKEKFDAWLAALKEHAHIEIKETTSVGEEEPLLSQPEKS